MTNNFARTIFNKCFLNIKNNNVQQKRLESFKAALLKDLKDEDDDRSFVINKINDLKKLEKNEVRVQVHYCSLNKNDLVPFNSNVKGNFVPGYEFSGEVLEVGSDVKADIVTVGERVAVLSQNRGGFAQQCVVNAVDVWRLPNNIKRKDAAVLIFGHTNAMYAFSHLTTLNENTKVLITTGPAGLGLAAVDIAANIYKAKPIGICQSEELSALVRERGAFKTSTFKNKNLLKEYGGSDIIYDAIGGDYHKLINQCVKPEGQVLWAGPLSSYIPSPPLNSWLSVVNIEGLRSTNPEFYRSLVSDTLDLADQGMISAYISAEFDLDDIGKAVKYIDDIKCTGKVLIKVVDD